MRYRSTSFSFRQCDNMLRSSVLIIQRRHFFSYLDLDKQAELLKTVDALVAPGKGILTCNVDAKTFAKRIEGTKIKNDEATRRKYCQLVVTTEGLSKYVSGMILNKEAVYQSLDDGTNFVKALEKRGIVPGVKVDEGVSSSKSQPGEFVTEGLTGLDERCDKYKKVGCRFTKWRSVFPIQNVPVSTQGLRENAKITARVAVKCQNNGLVPIVEADVMPIGQHTIMRAQKVVETVLCEVFKALHDHHVFLEGIILRVSFIKPGQDSIERASMTEIARATLRALQRCIAPAVPAISFRGGGTSEEAATVLLNEVNVTPGRKPWILTFGYGRSSQYSALKAWDGKPDNVRVAQEELLKRVTANSLAVLGKYEPGSIQGVASEFAIRITGPIY